MNITNFKEQNKFNEIIMKCNDNIRALQNEVNKKIEEQKVIKNQRLKEEIKKQNIINIVLEKIKEIKNLEIITEKNGRIDFKGFNGHETIFINKEVQELRYIKSGIFDTKKVKSRRYYKTFEEAYLFEFNNENIEIFKYAGYILNNKISSTVSKEKISKNSIPNHIWIDLYGLLCISTKEDFLIDAHSNELKSGDILKNTSDDKFEIKYNEEKKEWRLILINNRKRQRVINQQFILDNYLILNK